MFELDIEKKKKIKCSHLHNSIFFHYFFFSLIFRFFFSNTSMVVPVCLGRDGPSWMAPPLMPRYMMDTVTQQGHAMDMAGTWVLPIKPIKNEIWDTTWYLDNFELHGYHRLQLVLDPISTKIGTGNFFNCVHVNLTLKLWWMKYYIRAVRMVKPERFSACAPSSTLAKTFCSIWQSELLDMSSWKSSTKRYKQNMQR